MNRHLNLHIGHGFTLPLDAVTRTFGVLAQKGAGKSYTASVFVEELIGQQLHVVILDPTGAWWGLRTSADGKRPGLAISILGGRHGDLPLESTAGALVADLVVDEHASMVLDLSSFSLGEQRRFVTDFAERLYHRNTEPLHVVIDEADEFCPQRIPRGHERLVGAIDRIVRRGRIKGLGVTLISQRSAVIAKDVLTQIDTLIVMRTTGPQDRAAIDAWVSQNGTAEQRTELLGSLASLPIGTAWVWSPGWLGVFQRVAIRARDTYDSSATPTVGGSSKAPRVLAAVDLDAIRARMAETIERAKADDPRELRRQLAEARREIEAAKAQRAPEPVQIRVPVLPEGFGAEMRGFIERLETALVGLVAGVESSTPRRVVTDAHPPPKASPPVSKKRPSGPSDKFVGGAVLAVGETRVLTAIAQHPDGCTREQLTVLTGYKRSSRDTYLQRLSAAGLIDRGAGDALLVTRDGLAALGPGFKPLPQGSALRAHWLGILVGGERAVLEVVVAAHPRPLSREAISQATNYKRSSRDTYLQRLHARRLVAFTSGGVHASDALFDGGRR